MKKLISMTALLVPLVLNAVTIAPTQLDSDHEKQRERAFEEWTADEDQQAQFDKFLNQKGKFSILTERKDGKFRTIYITKPDTLGFWSWFSMSENELLEKHRTYLQDGFILLSLLPHVDNSGEKRYWATWISSNQNKQIMKDMKRFGMTQAKIEIDKE